MKYNVKETDGPAASASAAVIIARRNKEKVLVGGYVKRGDKKEEKTATAHRSTSSFCVFFSSCHLNTADYTNYTAHGHSIFVHLIDV